MKPDDQATILSSDGGAETEWWYYHGHLHTDAGEFGFHLVFFRRCTKKIKIGRIIHGRHFYDNAWFAHLSICDVKTKTFHYGERRSGRGSSTSIPSVQVAEWSVYESNGVHQLSAVSNAYQLDLELTPAKATSKNHINNAFVKTPGDETTYQTITRMHVQGQLTVNGTRYPTKGTAWMDRESGSFKLNQHLSGWDWFAIQTQDQHELMIYRMRDVKGNTTPRSIAVISQPDGSSETSSLDDWQIVPTRYWLSKKTGIRYPVDWRITETNMKIDLRLTARVDHAEMDARGSSYMIYWEGPVAVSGTMSGKEIQASAYMELVGHNSNRYLGSYDYERENLPFLDWIYSSARYLFNRKGVTISHSART